ncbi:unnamed protein product [Caenorhabditis sp. 36 PRJEB53466]|nr:unnamed protein product [Caenorhabditis sp. 36 PRJEB53466]
MYEGSSDEHEMDPTSEGPSSSSGRTRTPARRRSARNKEEEVASEERTSSLRKRSNPSALDRPAKTRRRFTDEEIKEMWLFVVNKIRDPFTDRIIKLQIGLKTWTEFKMTSDSPRDAISFYCCFRRLVHTLYTTNFDLQTKANLHYALSIPIENQEFLEELRQVADIVLDSHQRIVAYRKKRVPGALLNMNEDYWDEVWDEEAIRRVEQGDEGAPPPANFDAGEEEEEDTSGDVFL